MKKIEFFKIEGNKITRQGRHCPKCGPGIFLAEHKNRYSCGKCGYTEFKGGGKKEIKPPKIEEKPNNEIKSDKQVKVEVESEVNQSSQEEISKESMNEIPKEERSNQNLPSDEVSNQPSETNKENSEKKSIDESTNIAEEKKPS